MKWSNLFFLTATALGAAPLAFADDAPAFNPVERKPLATGIRVMAEADGDAGAQPQRVVVIADETDATVIESGGASDVAKAIMMRMRLGGDGQGFVFVADDAPGAEAKQVPFIGVVTSPLSEQVRAQTTLTEDVGLSVDSVSPDSPAAKAGLKAHDILAKYDDQILCAAVQLSALVKRTGTGNKATLTVLRGGKEMPIEVTVGEHAAVATFKMEGFNIAVGQPGEAPVVAGQPLAPEILKALESQGLKLGGAIGGGQGDLFAAPVPVPGVPLPPLPPNVGAQRNQRIVLVNPNVQSQSQSVAIVANDDGRVELREVNGKRTVTILDKAGAQLYTGPLDTQEDREAIPEALRGGVEQAEAVAPKSKLLPLLSAPVPVDPNAPTLRP
jgi:membrane-associated protease RseP (regulator of RpoE activity)